MAMRISAGQRRSLNIADATASKGDSSNVPRIRPNSLGESPATSSRTSGSGNKPHAFPGCYWDCQPAHTDAPVAISVMRCARDDWPDATDPTRFLGRCDEGPMAKLMGLTKVVLAHST